VSNIVLDAGALIALERNDREMWAALKVASASGGDVLVPSTALAQVWRGTPSQAHLARALALCVIAPFDPLARAVGTLCGRAGAADVCAAHVALVAARRGEVLYTSDPKDLQRLLRALGRRMPTVLRC
jgi:hypothetical protein